MIKSNTLPQIPDIYGKKEKKKEKKEKKGKYYVHVETTNPSFLKMYKLLGMLGIENRDYFLAIYDKSLIGVDPFDPDLDLETKVRVFKECCKNFWYYIREVVRIVVPGGTKQYALHRGNLAINWCLLNNINFFVELPRQNFKSVSIDVALSWLYNFGTTNSTMLIMNKEHKDAKENLARIREIINALPEYLRFNTRFNAEDKELKVPQNKEDAFNHKTNNKLVTKPCATSVAKADMLGRGMTSPVQWYDEFGFLKFNMVIYAAASPAAGQAAEEAAKNGKPYCKMISTTPGDMNTEYGRDAYAFKTKCAKFKEDFYDWKIKEVKQFVKINSSNGFFNIVFSYQQLGRGTEYFDRCVTELSGDMFRVRREVLLEWITTADESPFEAEDLERLKEITYSEDNAKSIYINKYYVLRLYKEISKNDVVMVSCDVGSGARRDYSTVAITDTRTKECIGEFCNNKVDTIDFADIIYTIATNVCPNCVVAIERNNVGSAVLAALKRTNIKSKLYYEVTDNELQEKIKNGRMVDNATDSRNYGVWTDDTKREAMMELLVKFVHMFINRVRTPILAAQISQLIFNKQGRIDHKPQLHDDMVMGYLIGVWVLYYGKNIQKYGIIRMPDVDPATGKTEDEVYAERLIAEKLRDEQLEKTYEQLTEDPNMNNKIPEFKTINDYYAELDRAKETAYDTVNHNNGRVSLERLLGNNSMSNNNSIDMLRGNPFSDDNSNFGEQYIDDIIGGDI